MLKQVGKSGLSRGLIARAGVHPQVKRHQRQAVVFHQDDLEAIGQRELLVADGELAGGLYGIRNKMELGAPFVGNGYETDEIPRIPWNIVDAINLWENSTIAKESFGEEVHHHILTMAKAEWQAFNHAVTDWELRRYWERI